MFDATSKLKFVSLKEADRIMETSCIKENLKGKLSVNLRDAVILLMTSMDHQKSVVSRTLMQKEVFLLYDQILRPMGLSYGPEEDAGFIFYKYGPYSYKLNVVLSSLVFTGKIRVNNFYQAGSDSDKPLNRFLTLFETDAEFSETARNYTELLSDRNISAKELKFKISERKRSWDQSGYRGITKLILEDSIYAKRFNKVKLKDSFPKVSFGKITEDYIPRLKVR